MLDLSDRDGLLVHHLRNFLIVSLSLVLLPISLAVTLIALLFRQLGIIRLQRRQLGRVGKPAPRVLVTGVKMAKGLFLARTMYLGGCDVVGADFNDGYGNLYCGRFSRSIRKFFDLKDPVSNGADAYISQVVRIINSEKIDLWISCSGVATAVEDARLASAIEKSTKCKVFQFDEKVISTLDDKLAFMKKTTDLQLANIRWSPLNSTKEIPGLLKKIESSHGADEDVKYMIKSANMDDATRGSLPLVSSKDPFQAEKTLRSLDLSTGRKWVLQEFIASGEEYCTHAVIVKGKIRAFTACPSASVLMHYKVLDPNTILYKKMLEFTKEYARGLGDITGHMSFDFLIRYRSVQDGFSGTMAPIECNPRCHTATVLFEGMEHDLADCYLETLTGPRNEHIVQPKASDVGFFWMAHDLIVLGAASILGLALGPSTSSRVSFVEKFLLCVKHMITWRDQTFLWWDPLPWLVLNHAFWPLQLILASAKGTKWKALNVSTTKVFKA